ncbi:unnamed protein product [Macrosiphum euphorbiae]|uniref:BESS domain-containing protein n=1 Tax=Macrosiphum euphorbiae TaxID=13131 RepID=A0AAV0Y8D4_9HEMI|nr:unnamed protein product [Macrosiphum euphorbiae]
MKYNQFGTTVDKYDKSVNSDEGYGMVVGKDISVEDIFDNKEKIKRRQDIKRRKKEKTQDPEQQFETKILSLLNNLKSEPDDSDKSFLLSLLPEFKTVDQNHKPQLYIDILNTIQHFKRTHSQQFSASIVITNIFKHHHHMVSHIQVFPIPTHKI